jgi:hypothetical protein
VRSALIFPLYRRYRTSRIMNLSSLWQVRKTARALEPDPAKTIGFTEHSRHCMLEFEILLDQRHVP